MSIDVETLRAGGLYSKTCQTWGNSACSGQPVGALTYFSLKINATTTFLFWFISLKLT
jgi:hypothetical protein